LATLWRQLSQFAYRLQDVLQDKAILRDLERF
jgi:hypothetical protein